MFSGLIGSMKRHQPPYVPMQRMAADGRYYREFGQANNEDTGNAKQNGWSAEDLLLFLLLLAALVLGTFAVITGSLSLHETYAYDGVIPTINRQLTVLDDNTTLYEEELQKMNATVCNRTAELNLTCAQCVNDTLLVVNDTIVPHMVTHTLVVQVIYIINGTNNVTYNLVVVLNGLYNKTLVLQQLLDAIQCRVNGSLSGAGAWDDTVTYDLLQYVSYNSSTWLSLISSNTNNTPGTDPAIWSPLTGVGPPGPPGGVGPPGPPGANGTDDTPCVNGTKGPPGLVPMGNWSIGSSYVPSAFVTHNGSAYVARVPTTGDEPGVNTTAWYLYVEPGDPGDAGGAGPPGPKGPYADVIGVWDDITAYIVGQLVNHNGTLYLAELNNTNSTPADNTTAWTVIGGPGDPGPPGASGANGTDCFAVTTASFTQPALNSNVLVSVNKLNVQSGRRALLLGAGVYEVTTSAATPTITLRYINTSNVLVGAGGTVPSGTRIFPLNSASVGPTGLAGNPGTPGANSTRLVAVSPMGFRATICPSCTDINATVCSVLYNTAVGVPAIKTSYIQFTVQNNTASAPTGDYVINSTMLVGGDYQFGACSGSPAVLGGCCADSPGTLKNTSAEVTNIRLYGSGAYYFGVLLNLNFTSNISGAQIIELNTQLVVTNISPSLPTTPYQDRWITLQALQPNVATGTVWTQMTFAASDTVFVPVGIDYVDYALRVKGVSGTYSLGGASDIVAPILGGNIFAQRL